MCEKECVWFRLYINHLPEGLISRTFNTGRLGVGYSWKQTFVKEAVKVTVFSKDHSISRVFLKMYSLHSIEDMLLEVFGIQNPTGTDNLDSCTTTFRLVGHTSRLPCSTTLSECSRNHITCNCTP